MNSIATQEFGILHETQSIRAQILDILTDADLAYKFPGNPTLGELCVYIGEIQHTYSESFRTFKQDWSYKNTEAGLSTSVQKLKAWFQLLDMEMDQALMALDENDIQSRMIERGFPIPVRVQIHIYREALLIFYAKAVMYLNAMGKPLPQQLREWIG